MNAGSREFPPTMLLAEALASRKAILKRLSEVETRLTAAAVSYEDEKPDDDASALKDEIGALASQFEDLSTRINQTNNDVTFRFDGQEMSMMQGVALRERLLLQQRALKRVADAVDNAVGHGRYGYNRRTKDDVKQTVHLSASSLRKESEQVAQRIERLNIAMQSINWTTEVIG